MKHDVTTLPTIAKQAWKQYTANVDVPTVTLGVSRLVSIRSDPADGRWFTCMAEVSLCGDTFQGFATGRSLTGNLRWRAIGEAVERAVWSVGVANPPVVPIIGLLERESVATGGSMRSPAIRLGDSSGVTEHVPRDFISGPRPSDDGPARAESSTTGSAVHQSPQQAVVSGAYEVLERTASVSGFHRRYLGKLVSLPAGFCDIEGSVEIACWYDIRTGLVSVALFGERAVPRVAMSARIAHDRDIVTAATHCLGEIVQSRAWIRRQARTSNAVDSYQQIFEPETRAQYWCSVPPAEAHQVIRELLGNSDCGPSVGPAIAGPADLYLAAAAEIKANGGDTLWYARVVGPEYAYCFHSGDAEFAAFGPSAPRRTFQPHPFI